MRNSYVNRVTGDENAMIHFRYRKSFWGGIGVIAGYLAYVGLLMLSGCLEERTPVAVPTHPEGWNLPQSEQFHGQALLTGSLSQAGCRSCHGNDFSGGSSGVSCYGSGCHSVYPHPPGFADAASSTFHEDFIAETLRWRIEVCRSCHGEDYFGKGVAAKNCLRCHADAGGPEACHTCHGSRNNIAPPPDLHDHNDPGYRGVGAHQSHMQDTTWTTFTVGGCGHCHEVPLTFDAPSHIDDASGAEVQFDAFASFEGKVTPRWNGREASCSAVYCHGAFRFRQAESAYPWAYSDSVMTGNFPVLYWQYPGTGQALCGSCHGLPPTGHIAGEDCAACHGRVVNRDLKIINKHLHINGQVDVF